MAVAEESVAAAQGSAEESSPKAPEKKVVKKEPEPPKDFASAVRLSEAGKPKEALAFLQDLAEKEFSNAEVWRELGIACFRVDQFEEAVEPLGKAAQLNPQDAKSWFYLGAAYRAAKRPWDAEGAYKKVLEVDPNHKEAPDDLKGVRIALAILCARGEYKVA